MFCAIDQAVGFKTVNAALLAAVVVLCPMLDHGHGCGPCTCKVPKCCSGTQHLECEHAATSRHGPPLHDGDHHPLRGSTKDCLCKGAVMPASLRTAMEQANCDTSYQFDGLASLCLAPVTGPAAVAVDFSGGCHLPPLITSSERCSLLGCRLL